MTAPTQTERLQAIAYALRHCTNSSYYTHLRDLDAIIAEGVNSDADMVEFANTQTSRWAHWGTAKPSTCCDDCSKLYVCDHVLIEHRKLKLRGAGT